MTHEIMLDRREVLEAIIQYMNKKGYKIKKYQFISTGLYEGLFNTEYVDAYFEGIKLFVDE